MLNGPATQPAGSVAVSPSENLYNATVNNPAGTTFWLSTGTYTLGTDQYNQVIPRDNDTYIGAPGAILDGQGKNDSAFTSTATGVTIEYLTIQNFVSLQDQALVNHDSGSNWTIKYDTIQNNLGVGAMAGSNSVFQYNCITHNAQTGIQGVHGTAGVVIDHNEISFNGLPGPPSYCGCEANVKLFGVSDVAITGNWIHDGGTQGLWGDTDGVGWLIQDNYINNNNDEAIFFETSYNALITRNNILNNTLAKGARFTAVNDSFPIAAIYISESGGDSRVYGGKYSTFEVSNNNVDGNYGGITLWEDPNRFCNTVGNNSPGFCPIAGTEATPAACVAPGIASNPLYFDCRWHTQNVKVVNNTFRVDTDGMGCTGTRCGENSLFSNYGSRPPWSPYQGDVIDKAITFNQNNHFANNAYVGNWNFDVYQQGNQVNKATWTAAPYNQDTGSTFTSLPTANVLDANTATLEGSPAHWAPGVNDTVGQSNAQAHSGNQSLIVGITAPGGWSVMQDGSAKAQAHPGPKVESFWAMTTAASPQSAAMHVSWTDNSGKILQTDAVTIPALNSTWQQGFLSSNAPVGTSYASITLTGVGSGPGDFVYMDDIVVGDNALDYRTANLEGPAGGPGGAWAATSPTKIANSTAQAHSGSASLLVNVVAKTGGWAVALKKGTSFPEIPGPKTLSFWGLAGSGAALQATLQVMWRDAYGNVLQTDTITTPTLTNSWQQAKAVVTAPPGTEQVGLALLNSSGVKGNSLYLDDFIVASGVV